MNKKFFLPLFVVSMMSGVALSADETVVTKTIVEEVETSKEVEQASVEETQEVSNEEGCGCAQ